MLSRIAVLVSGGGTNLEHLLLAQEAGHIPHGEIVLVVSNNPGAYVIGEIVEGDERVTLC